jgi:hypothetical protein
MGKYRINELATSSKNKNIRLVQKNKSLQWGYQIRTNLLKDENGDLLADSHNNLNG